MVPGCLGRFVRPGNLASRDLVGIREFRGQEEILALEGTLHRLGILHYLGTLVRHAPVEIRGLPDSAEIRGTQEKCWTVRKAFHMFLRPNLAFHTLETPFQA
ncbi:hypothetical protein SLU01_15770 [Sporosarcina luteola]|uniref:Uncharacterized protein n=1 Tax=Sporosarcina luteola TaxID=582850 RepID=A0A511Z744_9BACL|nr:hypothetical protein SLU01_15770 [Sporosarcina luteola]